MSMTPRMKELLDFIRSYTAGHGGVSPSYDEMADAIGVRSKSNIHRLVYALQERGFIQVAGYRRARSISVVEDDELARLRSENAKLKAMLHDVMRSLGHPA